MSSMARRARSLLVGLSLTWEKVSQEIHLRYNLPILYLGGIHGHDEIVRRIAADPEVYLSLFRSGHPYSAGQHFEKQK